MSQRNTDDMKNAINYAVALLTNATEAETAAGTHRGATIAAMGVAEGTLRATLAYLDLVPNPGTPRALAAPGEMTGAVQWHWEALGHAVASRRHWLSMTQDDVANAGGPSEQTMTRIENGRRSKYTKLSLQRLETALRWPPDTITGILTGTITNLDDVITAPWAPTNRTERTKQSP